MRTFGSCVAAFDSGLLHAYEMAFALFGTRSRDSRPSISTSPRDFQFSSHSTKSLSHTKGSATASRHNSSYCNVCPLRRRASTPATIEAGEVELWTTPVGKWFPRAEMMAKALEVWPLHVIEEALGDDADGVLPQAIRCAELRVRLPRHHIDMLEYRADQQETTVSGVLARELDGIASAHIEELSAALPGFAEAMAWPG